jgi:1-deoxy-D-xylulose-5-phosphate reductoisomerase
VKKRVAILGSTGSIGTSALDVADVHADRVEVVGLAAGNNGGALSPAHRGHEIEPSD